MYVYSWYRYVIDIIENVVLSCFFLKSEYLESLNKDLDEGIKNDNFGFIFKKNILLSIVCFLLILKIFNFVEFYMSCIVRINYFV